MKTVQDLINHVNTLLEKNDFDEAEPILLVALKRQPKNPELLYLIGEVYCKQQRFQKSISSLMKADIFLPGNHEIIHLLGWALCMNDNVPEGLSLLQGVLKQHPKDIRLLCDLTVIEMRTGDFILAREHARTAAILAPEDDMVLEVNSVLNTLLQARDQIPQNN